MVANVGIIVNNNFLSNTDTSNDPLEKIIEKHKNHSSITCINKHINSELTFTFQPVKKNPISTLTKRLTVPVTIFALQD